MKAMKRVLVATCLMTALLISGCWQTPDKDKFLLKKSILKSKSAYAIMPIGKKI
jgi:hypothetical protein